ncbi:hypothetical protein FQA39_LY18551 [Lamprigera yunnana]|nr:hypothetical protein FQA39_LY18551 [Lamprigera yunnana]
MAARLGATRCGGRAGVACCMRFAEHPADPGHLIDRAFLRENIAGAALELPEDAVAESRRHRRSVRSSRSDVRLDTVRPAGTIHRTSSVVRRPPLLRPIALAATGNHRDPRAGSDIGGGSMPLRPPPPERPLRHQAQRRPAQPPRPAAPVSVKGDEGDDEPGAHASSSPGSLSVHPRNLAQPRLRPPDCTGIDAVQRLVARARAFRGTRDPRPRERWQLWVYLLVPVVNLVAAPVLVDGTARRAEAGRGARGHGDGSTCTVHPAVVGHVARADISRWRVGDDAHADGGLRRCQCDGVHHSELPVCGGFAPAHGKVRPQDRGRAHGAEQRGRGRGMVGGVAGSWRTGCQRGVSRATHERLRAAIAEGADASNAMCG